jgi:hypothetical protein
LFCDDIRFEQGGKISLMGIYGGEMIVESFPAVLPKLCMAAFMTSDIENQFSSLVMEIVVNDNIIQKSELPVNDLRHSYELVSSRGAEDDPIKTISVGFQNIISPVAFEKESKVTVRFIADGVEYIAGKLRVKCMQ